jgi:hypothetical protein
VNQPPVITDPRATVDPVDQLYGDQGCNSQPYQSSIVATVTDPDHPVDQLIVSFNYSMARSQLAGTVTLQYDLRWRAFVGALPEIRYGAVPADGDAFTITVQASDADGRVAKSVSLTVGVQPCYIIG